MAVTTKERLLKKRQQEQDQPSRNYSPSSRWYIGLNRAINFVDLAETSTAPIDRFRNAWLAIYSLSMMTHVRGQIENVTLSKWVELIKAAPTVRELCEQVSDDFLKILDKTKKALLRDTERNKWREAKEHVDRWQTDRKNGKVVSPDKACTRTFLIGRDLRNAVSHPTFNPNAATTKRALSGAADLFLPIAIAAIESTIEHPPENTTGKATAYCSFLYPFMINSDSFFSDYYLEKLMPDQELSGFDDAALKETLKQLDRDRKPLEAQLSEEDAGRELTAQLWCEPFLFLALGIEVQSGIQIVSEQAVFEPSYAIAQPDTSVQKEYQGKAAGKDLACLIWVVPWRSRSLDAVPEEEKYREDFSGLTWMEIGQRSLLASDVPWAIVTNGRKLRLLGKGTAHKPRAFVEMTLEEIINQRGKDEGKLAFRYLLGLFSGAAFTEQDEKDRTRLDRVLAESERHGKEISDELKQNVFRALEELGDGFLDYMRANADVVQGYEKAYVLEPVPDEVLLTDIYQESLSLMYRLLFLFYAESRDMLPMEDELYRESYSLESIRDEIIAIKDDPDPTQYFRKGSIDLWQRLTEQLFPLIQQGGLTGRIPAYNGGLFDPEKHPFLEHFAVGDYYLARAIDFLSRTRPSRDKPRGEGRKKVTYRDLDVRHLGSIYEGILDYSAHIADQEMAIVIKKSGGSQYEEYVTVDELKAKEREDFNAYKKALEEDPEDPIIASRSKITDIKEKGQYFLVLGGQDSKRKSSGSYYTPDYIVQYIVDNTLGPLVRGENREGELNGKSLDPEEILLLKVLDPAMGSGHFLVAATEFLARAYGEAMIRTGRDNDGIMDDDEFIRYKRTVAEKCIYGVDLNPMAVELAKLSMWLFTMDRNRPLSFLNHHFRIGNTLIGAMIGDLGELPVFSKRGKLQKHEISREQINIFEQRFRERVPTILTNIAKITERETDTPQDIKEKKISEQIVEAMKRPFIDLADMWIDAALGELVSGYYDMLLAFSESFSYEGSISRDSGAFHWQLEFPEVFSDSFKERRTSGFDAIVGNPPYIRIQNVRHQESDFVYFYYRSPVGKVDFSVLFIEKSLSLLNQAGLSSFISTSQWLSTDYGKNIREILSEGYLRKIVDFGTLPVFQDVETYPAIFTMSKAKQDFLGVKRIREKAALNLASINTTDTVEVSYKTLNSAPWNLDGLDVASILIRGKLKIVPLKEIGSSYYGIVSGCDPAFIIDAQKADELKLEESLLYPFAYRGNEVSQYATVSPNGRIIYPYIEDDSEGLVLIPENDLRLKYPNIHSYLWLCCNNIKQRKECCPCRQERRILQLAGIAIRLSHLNHAIEH